MTKGGEKVPVKGDKNPTICRKPQRNYVSVSFSDLASELFNHYQFPLVKTIESYLPFVDITFFFLAKKIHMCRKSFDKRLRRDTLFPVCKIYVTKVAKRLRVEFCPWIYMPLLFNGSYVPYSSDQPWHLERTPARKPNAYFIDMLQLLLLERCG